MTRVIPDADITDVDLQIFYEEWLRGRTKNDIERVEWKDPYSHGKRCSRLWRERLGFETENRHQLAVENERLRRLLEEHGINPQEET